MIRRMSTTFAEPTWGHVDPAALRRILVVSPHFDDAAMGAGHLIASYDDTTVVASTDYTYTVAAYDAAGTSSSSLPANIETPAPPKNSTAAAAQGTRPGGLLNTGLATRSAPGLATAVSRMADGRGW